MLSSLVKAVATGTLTAGALLLPLSAAQAAVNPNHDTTTAAVTSHSGDYPNPGGNGGYTQPNATVNGNATINAHHMKHHKTTVAGITQHHVKHHHATTTGTMQPPTSAGTGNGYGAHKSAR